MGRRWRKLLRTIARHDPAYYDMYTNADEAFFARLYLEPLLRDLRACGITPPARILDAGCQTGRLAIPLARAGYEVIGVDTSRFALHWAARHARDAGVRMRLLRGDLRRGVPKAVGGAFDAVVCAEVLYQLPEFRDILDRLRRVLRPGGLLAVSHRSPRYYELKALRHGDTVTAAFVREHEEGPYGDAKYLNWQTAPQLERLYRGLGLSWRGAYAIDRYAWMARCRPATLPVATRERLFAVECRRQARDPDFARYVLVLAQRPAEAR